MSVESAGRITRSIEISALTLLFAWFLVLVLPIAGSLLAIDYFLTEYALFAKPGELERARQNIEECRELLVTENFLTSRINALERLTLPVELQNPDELQKHVDLTILGKAMMLFFFDDSGSNLTLRSSHPPEFKRQMPPAPLFRKQIQTLLKYNYLTEADSEPADDPETIRNSLQIQQMFKTITPVIVKPGQAVKNYSVAFGGEIFFVWFEFVKPQAGQRGCLAVVRGCDLSWPGIFSYIKQKHPAFRLTLKKQNVMKAISQPGSFYSGLRETNGKVVITAAADQRFIRSWLHNSGVRLNQKDHDFSIPFIEYHLATENFQHSFQKIRKHLWLLGKILIVLSLVLLMRMLLFGINLDISFKRRILASVVLISFFPYAFLSIGFYMQSQYDDFLARMNMLQHIEISLAQTNNELNQFFATLESSFLTYARKIDRAIFKDDAAIYRMFAEIGRAFPISAVAVHRPTDSLSVKFPERISPGSENSSVMLIESFIPKRSMLLLLEPEPITKRERQDMIDIAGNLVKSASIQDGMRSNGQFYYVDQTQNVIWYSTVKLYDESDPAMPFMGLMGSKFEAGPILKSHLRQTSIAKNGFRETFGKYTIKYAFLPTERTGTRKIWSGSGYKNEASIKMMAKKENSNMSSEIDASGNIGFIVSRYNYNIPHVAVAMATCDGQTGDYLQALGGLLAYLCLVFFLVNLLLEKFFVFPVVQLARNAERIARGGDKWNLSLTTGDEFEQLNVSFSELVVGLQQRNMLRDYVSEDAISEIEAAGVKDMAPGGEYLEATVIFAALRNYSEMTADFTPEQTVELINRFITCGDDLVKKHGGTIDKIIDNTLMLVFRASETQSESHALRAVRTALELASEMHRLNLDIYAGIASGTVISGRIGSYSGKLDYTVIGDQVNLAARLKNEAIDSSSGLIISGSTMRMLKGKGRVNFLRRCSLKGKSREYNIYELYELR
ncbi:MAG: hypothetical protein CVV42_18095 [Candidatus Riflebacteria bacterium HGW-Riflebacteria-2]|jgi:class 3 adenylate cyclase|nr:MAG: hypothetical protein CVV42_18095 [Candidatus Riflebacteria bacterium HGW-Riflebacteria-2]